VSCSSLGGICTPGTCRSVKLRSRRIDRIRGGELDGIFAWLSLALPHALSFLPPSIYRMLPAAFVLVFAAVALAQKMVPCCDSYLGVKEDNGDTLNYFLYQPLAAPAIPMRVSSPIWFSEQHLNLRPVGQISESERKEGNLLLHRRGRFVAPRARLRRLPRQF
jgi:hypothetical protein